MLLTKKDIKSSTSFTTLSWVLGDQLNHSHSWYKEINPHRLFVIAELRQETDYTRHHVQKICAFFAAMRAFAEQLSSQGHTVLYLDLDATADNSDLSELINSLCECLSVKAFCYQRPDEIRLLDQFRSLNLTGKIVVSEFDTEHFYLPFDDLQNYVKKGQHNRMESFYRKMRKRFNVLMDGSTPLGEKWNFDSDNRNKLKKADLENIPAPLTFANDVSEILKLLEKHQVAHFGKSETQLLWPVDRRQSLDLLNWFCTNALSNFGRFQDAMTCQSESKWSLYHSRLSFALNSKLLSPREVISAAIEAYKTCNGEINLAQLEGFVRQILGWREFVRGIYWVNQDDYRTLNHFNASRKLPDYFWDGNTHMRCMSEAIGQSLETSYGHHIQRLMVTGNFCMIAGIDPDQVDAWYLGIYIDAIEWVEMPNTRGMSQFADGGYIATKPYSASGNYINKMSDYCSNCHYSVKEKSGPKSCPFNSLYWKFMVENRKQLASNPRIGMLFKSWDKKSHDERELILNTAKANLKRIETL
ncbi:MAG: cryptochrome/photolyase family protein [Pseudohongiellaceae bacterium]